MTDIRELRLSLEKKLTERRDLITRNSVLRHDNHRKDEQIKFQGEVMKSRAMNFALDDCADQIVHQILEEAIKASRVIAEQSLETGDYTVGISMDSLHVRHHINRMDMNMLVGDDMPEQRTVRHISVKSSY